VGGEKGVRGERVFFRDYYLYGVWKDGKVAVRFSHIGMRCEWLETK
jgi:hypothetical protein